MTHEHHYRAAITWSGSTGSGYAAYSRAHRLSLPPAEDELELSSDPAFRGDPALPNPEALLLGAAASCQLLSFLALAARKRVDVVAYEDAAEAVMPEDIKPIRITQITLRPHITVADGTDADEVLRLVQQAHEECYVANSLNVGMVVNATIVQLVSS